MTEPLRILLHNAETSDIASMARRAHPKAIVETCQSYAALSAHLDALRPHAVYTVRFAGSDGYPRDALFGPNGPRWVANGGAGTDHFGIWDTTRVTVTNAAGVAADMMAEYVMGGFLHFALDVPGLQSDKAQRRWPARTVRPLKDATLLIVGLGQTGRAIARLAQSFGMIVIGTRARPEPMEHVDEVHPADHLHAVLPRADFVAVCTPLTPATRNLLSVNEFALMKPGVVFTDVSRGGVIDGTALLGALSDGHVAGAALDVFETEPLPADSPFWAVENALISPHCSSVYDGWEAASFDLFLNNLARWVEGKELFNIVDPNRGY
ncbi:D-2-hydroxyacid dehydrogenase [uncultured Tateyamaria sp.]|uniref:D-2-hydroxyacid dehydrogenase n=1 Tax=uncultured Tateyamaria sp. TaxID=455651 RepID=UPI002612EA9B|nr:D-2-hydroxyacid dehydrogenase [uncultured Tateyamaria sp.]